MASPQIEDGYTRISNELLEAIYNHKFIATQYKIILACCRFTYGFQRKSARLSISFLGNATGVAKRYVAKEIKELIKQNVLIEVVEPKGDTTREISLNKDYSSWKCATTIGQSYSGTMQPQEHTTVLPQEHTTVLLQYHQERKHKDNSKERNEFGIPLREKDIGSESDLVLPEKKSNKEIDDFFETIWQLYPIKKGKAEVKPSAKRELYKLGLDKIKSAIEKYTKETNPKYYMHGRRFFNTSYIDYVTCDSTPKKQEIKFIEVDADDYRDNFEKYYKP